jgi:hypothetical protein
MAHIAVMTATAKSRPPKTRRRPANPGPTYRGVRIQSMQVGSRFTSDQIRQAVDAALAKNADALAGGPKP